MDATKEAEETSIAAVAAAALSAQEEAQAQPERLDRHGGLLLCVHVSDSHGSLLLCA